MKLGRLLRVTWRDSVTKAGWQTQDALEEFIREDVIIRTVGWKMHEDALVLVLAQSVMLDDGRPMNVDAVMRIPVGCILKRERLGA